MSRRPLAIGELGNITVAATQSGVTLEARTRDASGSLRRLQASGSTEEIARDELARKARRLGLKVHELSLATTLSELLDAWLAVAIAPRGIKQQTKQAYKGQAGTIKRLAGALTIAELRPARLQTLLEELAKDLTPANLKLMRSVLNQCLRYAVRTEVISHNPMDALDRVRALKKPRRKKALTPELIHLFRTEFADYVRERPDVLGRRQAQLTTDIIIGLGGLRIAEALAFRHRDIDFDRCIADLNGTLVSLSGQPIYRQDTLKYEEQSRFIRLEPNGIGMTALRAARSLAKTIQARQPDAPLLPAQRAGGWISYNTVASHFDAVTKRPDMVAALTAAGLIPDDLTPHTLRRTVATVVTRSDEDGLEVAAGLLGHSNSRVTNEEYVVHDLVVVDASQSTACWRRTSAEHRAPRSSDCSLQEIKRHSNGRSW